jgi:hypothetical protein
LAFTVFPTTLRQQCTGNGQVLAPVIITLDNSASTAVAGWVVTISGTVPGTQAPWAVGFPRSGTVPAGQMASLTLRPHASLCARLSTLTTFRAHITLTSGGAAMYPIADTIVPTDSRARSSTAASVLLSVAAYPTSASRRERRAA